MITVDQSNFKEATIEADHLTGNVDSHPHLAPLFEEHEHSPAHLRC